ncbi:hypothetical protein DFJ74DRAFT_659746 [Hyaloraphidium curvatum]|nr:hypothetical protein DFJ74DRAFT_659746 [Hyaloraphidium curvatum]
MSLQNRFGPPRSDGRGTPQPVATSAWGVAAASTAFGGTGGTGYYRPANGAAQNANAGGVASLGNAGNAGAGNATASHSDLTVPIKKWWAGTDGVLFRPPPTCLASPKGEEVGGVQVHPSDDRSHASEHQHSADKGRRRGPAAVSMGAELVFARRRPSSPVDVPAAANEIVGAKDEEPEEGAAQGNDGEEEAESKPGRGRRTQSGGDFGETADTPGSTGSPKEGGDEQDGEEEDAEMEEGADGEQDEGADGEQDVDQQEQDGGDGGDADDGGDGGDE